MDKGMSLEELLIRFARIRENPYPLLSQWKQENNRKIVGCFPMHVPEELIHAAGFLPVTTLGSHESISQVDAHLPSYLCSPMRSNLDLALRGKLDFLDGMIWPDICDQVKNISDIWKLHHPTSFDHHYMIPAKISSPTDVEYLRGELVRLRTSLEEYSGREITDRALQESIALYNRGRALMRRLYDLRRADLALLRARDVAAAITASKLMLREEYNDLLSDLLARAEVAKPSSKDKVRVVLSGSLCHEVEGSIFDLIEQVGGTVVDDDLYLGSRCFVTQVNEAGDPIEALVERHLSDVPCSTKYNPDKNWGDYLVNLAKRAGARGVIVLLVKFCEPLAFDYPYLQSKLSEADIPCLLLETEHGEPPLGAFRTRLEAFIEMIEGE